MTNIYARMLHEDRDSHTRGVAVNISDKAVHKAFRQDKNPDPAVYVGAWKDVEFRADGRNVTGELKAWIGPFNKEELDELITALQYARHLQDEGGYDDGD